MAGEAGTGSGNGTGAARWAAVAALAAIAAAVIAYLSWEETKKTNDIAAAANSSAAESNRIADEGLSLAEKNEQRLDRQSADGVLLGEAPSEMKGKFPLPEGIQLWFVVYNGTSGPIENVWVSDAQQRSIKIEGIQPCRMYALEAGFKPTDLYFSDKNGLFWHRKYNEAPEQLTREQFPPMPKQDTGGDSPWDAPLENCSTG